MACTKQSAEEYIRNARLADPSLVGGLQNLSIILENLYQQEVFTGEEVSQIESEKNDFDKTRKILNSVTDKGACYELLKIIDKTRKRTLRPELHQWISCFPFEDDEDMDVNYSTGPTPCHRYQEKLKKKALKLSEDVWKQSNSFLPKYKYSYLSYTPLVLDTRENKDPTERLLSKSKKCKKSRPKKMNTYIPENKQELTVDNLLKTQEKDILLVGNTGIGKTTAACEILKLWGGSDNSDLDYMFYFDMRKITNPTSLEDLLFNMFSEPDEGKEEVLEDIKRNSENVTVIFDGLTNLSSSVIERLVDGDLLPEAKIVITCRPEFESEDFLSDWASLRVEVKGFSTKSIRAYLAKMLNSEQLSTIENNLELLSLCHVPVYALMVVACFSFMNPIDPKRPCTVTEICINILRGCIQKHTGKAIRRNELNNYIRDHCSEMIFSLAKAAFQATEGKSVNLTDLSCEESSVHSAFLTTLAVQVEPTEWKTHSAFLHYNIQEFFAALWFLKNPDKISVLLQQGCTKELKHVIPFLCGLCSEKNLAMLECLSPVQRLKDISKTFITDVVNTFLSSPLNRVRSDTGDSNILFLCQCLYESQSTAACLHFLDKLDYCLDLSKGKLDPHHYCSLSYVISQPKARKVKLKLDNTVERHDILLDLYLHFSSKGYIHLLPILKPLYPPAHEVWSIDLSDRKASVLLECLKLQPGKKLVELRLLRGWSDEESEVKRFLQCLPYISKLSFLTFSWDTMGRDRFRMNLCVQAALHEKFNTQMIEKMFSDNDWEDDNKWNFLLDLYSHAKDYETQTHKSVLPALLRVYSTIYQSAPADWCIDLDLSKRKASALLEVLKLQPEKREVLLRGWPDEESEMRIILQCLPYISQLGVSDEEPSKFLGKLICEAAEQEEDTGEKMLELFYSVSNYETFPWLPRYYPFTSHSDVLLGLYSYVKNYETQTGRSVLPALQPVYQSSPAVWTIDLSKRKVSILLEVLKLQPEKKPLELTGWPYEDSEEVRIFLQFLPYISQLRFIHGHTPDPSKFLEKLICEAAEREEETGEKILELLSSVCNYDSFLEKINVSCTEEFIWCRDYQSRDLLDLYSYVKNYESQTGRSVLPALQPVFQSAPAKWYIDLSERKVSLLLEVLKLQLEKKPVELRGWSDEESEVKRFLQCLPYISQLSVLCQEAPTFLGKLICEAAEQEEETGEKILELLSSVCNYKTFPLIDWDDDHYDGEYQCDVLLGLYSHVKNYETQTGRSVLPALQPVYQSAPTVWSIDLSERKASLLLEVLKLKSEKKPVELTGWSDEESEVRLFLQCLPYISQLSVWGQEASKFLGKLICEAAEQEEETGEKILELLSSVCNDKTFPLRVYDDEDGEYRGIKYQCGPLLDLYSCVKNYETQTGRSVLPALQAVYQSHAVWSIDQTSEGKASILLEVLKLQPEKKPVDLWGWSDEESELRIFFQCLPYISQLRCSPTLLLKLISMVPWGSERETVMRCLAGALGRLNLSKTTLDQTACRRLALVLEHSEGLTRLDLSECQLTDQLLKTLIPHLHKAQVLDLSDNKLTDALTDRLLQLPSINPSIQTVWLSYNYFKDKTPFLNDKRFKI